MAVQLFQGGAALYVKGGKLIAPADQTLQSGAALYVEGGKLIVVAIQFGDFAFKDNDNALCVQICVRAVAACKRCFFAALNSNGGTVSGSYPNFDVELIGA